MLVVLGTFRLPLQMIDAARPLMVEVVSGTLAEPGCRAYSYAEDMAEPGLFRVMELWDSHEALSAHFQAPHMLHWMEQRARLGFSERNIAVHELGPAQAL